MKICMYSIDKIAQKNTGGIKRFAELIKVFQAKGFEVELFSPDTQADMKRMKVNGYSIPQANTRDRKFVGLRSIFGNNGIFKEIRERNFDKIIVFDVRAAVSLVFHRMPHIQLFLRQDMISYKKIQYKDKKICNLKQKILLEGASLLEAVCLKCAEKIIIQCRYDYNQLIMRHNLLKKNIEKKSFIQINNINPSWNKEIDKKNTISNKYYDLIFIGNFRDSRKGHDLLFEALKYLTDSGLKFKTAVMGDGNQLSFYKNKFKQYSNIVFLGRIDKPMDLMENSRLLIVPSYADSCPNTVMEGLFYRVPVIGSNRGGIPEILNRKEWLFEMEVTSIAKAIRFYLEKENNQKLQQDQMKRREELFFDWGEKIIKIIEN